MPFGRGRSGFTLVEVLVALVVLEVGLLGVVGTLLLATRWVQEAEARQTAAGEVALLVDSLGSSGAAGGGRREGAWGTLSWSGRPGGAVEIRITRGGDEWVVETRPAPPSSWGLLGDTVP